LQEQSLPLRDKYLLHLVPLSDSYLMLFCFSVCNFAKVYLFANLPQPGDNKMTFVSSNQVTTCYSQSIHSKVEVIPLSALPKDTTSELASLSSRYPFNAECQVRKPWIPTFKVYWFDSTSDWISSL